MVIAGALLALLAAAQTPPIPQTPPTLQTLTPERLNAETPPIVSGLQWMDKSHVAGNVKVGKETTRRMWSLTGGPSRVVAAGESRNSPDGTRIVTL